jgi:putative ABC transport system substrate-binding protein
MKRREFISLVGGAAALWSQVASAQNPSGVRRIGVLLSLAETDPEGKAQLSGFTQGLAELGWIDGRNLRMEIRWGRGDIDRIRTFAKELVALQPDVILAHGTPVTAALHRETRTIPIVFVTVSDPVGDGFVAGLPHPGGNITGFLTSESTITAKMFELLTEIAPGLKRVAICSIRTQRPEAGLITSAISSLRSDRTTWSRSQRAPVAMPKSKLS